MVKEGQTVNGETRDDLWKKHFQGSQFFTQYREHEHQRAAFKRQLAISEEELSRMNHQYVALA